MGWPGISCLQQANEGTRVCETGKVIKKNVEICEGGALVRISAKKKKRRVRLLRPKYANFGVNITDVKRVLSGKLYGLY